MRVVLCGAALVASCAATFLGSTPQPFRTNVRRPQIARLPQRDLPHILRYRRVRLCAAEDGAADEEEEEASTDEERAATTASAPSADEAQRVLGLGPDDSDLISYLRAGRTLLSRRVSIILPSDCEVLSECLLIVADKLCKLGATVEVLTDRTVEGASNVPWTASVPYPRCVARPVNLTSIGELAGALQRVNALVLCADSLPAGGLDALRAALPLAGVSDLSAAEAALGAGAGAGAGAAAAAAAAAEAEAQAAAGQAGAAGGRGVQQMVLLSSVRVYGTGVHGTGLEASELGRLSEEEAMEAARVAAKEAERVAAVTRAAGVQAERAAGLQATEEPSTGAAGDDEDDEDDEDEEEDLNAVAATMLDEESALQRASTARLAVLRACPLFAEEGTASAEFDSLLGDAIGLQELVAEYLADLDALPVRRPSRAVDPAQALAAMLPPASSLVQLTHTADLAGAAVFAILVGLQGAFHVCAAPLTMQRLFDGLSRRKEWERIVLPASAHDGANSGSAHYSTDKLEAAGYRLLHPRLLHDGAPTDEDLRGVVRRTPETAGAGSGPVSSSRDNSRDHAPDVPPEHD